MSLIDWTIVGAYILALIAMSWRDRNALSGSAAKVILGGRALTLPAFVASLVTTWYGGILGVSEYSYSYGISNWVVFGVPYYIGALVFALFLAKRARRSKALTLPRRISEQIGERSGFVAGLLVFVTSAPTAYLLGLGILIQYFMGVPAALAIVLAALFSVGYVSIGGFNAVVRTDELQFVLMFGGFVTLFAILFVNYGFWDFIVSHVPADHLSWTGGANLWYIGTWYIIAQGALVEPAFHQRCYAAHDEQTAKRGIIISIGFWALFDFLTTFCGLYAKALLPELANPALAFPQLALQILPPVALGLFVTGLLAVVMSTIDSNSFIAATTYSFDLLRASKNSQNELSESSLKRNTLIGLWLSTGLAALFALAFESIVDVWKEFGSVIMPALLAPALFAFFQKEDHKKKRQSLSDTQGLTLIILPALVSISWIVFAHLGENGSYPFGDYPFLSEPIFPGLYLSALLSVFFLRMNTKKNN